MTTPRRTRPAVRKPSGTWARFWLVVRDPLEVKYHSPTNSFKTEDDARKAAEGLAASTGHRFFLMAAVSSVETITPMVAWTDL